jgi:hypothetical protein
MLMLELTRFVCCALIPSCFLEMDEVGKMRGKKKEEKRKKEMF